MRMFYAASTKGFYTDAVHTEMPADVVEISPELHAALLEGEAAGKRIMPPDAEHKLPYLACGNNS